LYYQLHHHATLLAVCTFVRQSSNERDAAVAVIRLILEKEERLTELEAAVERATEATVDKDRLLEVMQGDKTALSRAIAQNKELKNQLAELQNSFVKMVRTLLCTNCSSYATCSFLSKQPPFLCICKIAYFLSVDTVTCLTRFQYDLCHFVTVQIVSHPIMDKTLLLLYFCVKNHYLRNLVSVVECGLLETVTMLHAARWWKTLPITDFGSYRL